ncbi:MAG: phospholipid carrier-dependent glycosyltransferase [Candidatus Promineifilaceae bacterium]
MTLSGNIDRKQNILHRYWAQWLLLLILLLGFGLRMYDLERQSMWSDEGLSLYRSGLSLADVAANKIIIDGVETRDTNPAFYFILLHLWRGVTGDSVTAMRAIGSLFGFLAIPLVYVLADLVYDRKVALAAALLMAISPLHVWHSQVMRNYGLLVTLNLFSVYGVMRLALDREVERPWRWLLLWAAAGLLGIYTHYFSLFVFAYSLLILGYVAWRKWDVRELPRRRWFWPAMAGIVLLTIPACLIAFNRFQAGQQIDFYRYPLTALLTHALSAFGVGVIQTLVHPWARVLPVLILFVLGILLGLLRKRAGTLLLLGYQFIPLGLLFLVSLINPLYNGARHLLIGLPPFLVLVANGMVGKGQAAGGKGQVAGWLRIALGTAVIVIQLSWLHMQFSDPALLRDDIRGAANYLNAVVEEEDVVVLHDAIIGFVFDYYYEGAAPWRAIPRYAEEDVAAAENELSAAGDEADRVWFLTQPAPRSGFPRDALSDWAAANWPRFTSKRFPHLLLPVGLEGYTPQPVLAALPEGVPEIGVQFADALRLEGLEIPQAVDPQTPWTVTWYWSRPAEAASAAATAGDYELSLRWRDADGRLWYQTDDLLWHEFPPTAWPEGSIVRFDLATKTPPALPPGSYELGLRVLDGEGRELLTEDGREELPLGTITVTAASQELPQSSAFTAQSGRLGPVDLLGYRLPSEKIRPGHEIPATFLWQIRGKARADYLLRVQLIDVDGEVIAESVGSPTLDSFLATAWSAGDIFQGKSSIAMPASARDEAYRMQISFVDPDSGEMVGRSIVLDQALQISPWPLETVLPEVDVALDAAFGEPPFVSIYGYDLADESLLPGGMLDLTLVWQAQQDVGESMMSFIHIADAEGNIVVQQDSVPVQGIRPTSSWREGEVIVDQHLIPIGPEVAPGSYEIWLGLYVPETGVRAAAWQDGQMLGDGRVLLGTIDVLPAE